MNYAKIFGWILLAAGLIIIGWSLFSAFSVFTGKQPPPEIFAEPEPVNNQKNKESALNIQTQLENMIGEQFKNMLPAGALPKVLNLTVYSILVFIMFSGGSQIAGLGIKMIKG